MSKKILITGASGFIGTHLVRALQVRGFTNLTLVDTKSVEVAGAHSIETSFGNLDLMRGLLSEHDVVFHLGAVVGVHTTLERGRELREVNREESKNFLDLVANSGVGKIIFTSSSEIYGNSTQVPFSEEQEPSPVSDYGKYKVEIEQHLKNLVSTHGVRATIVRLFNVYGIGQREDFVISRFINLAQTGKNLTVNWDGNQTRCFTYIDDVIEGLIKAMGYEDTSYEIFNLGSQEETSVLDLAKKVINLTNSGDSDIVIQNLQKSNRYDIARRVPDISKARSKLAFTPHVNLSEGLQHIINAS